LREKVKGIKPITNLHKKKERGAGMGRPKKRDHVVRRKGRKNLVMISTTNGAGLNIGNQVVRRCSKQN